MEELYVHSIKVYTQKYMLTYNISEYFVFLYEKKSNGPHLAHDTSTSRKQ